MSHRANREKNSDENNTVDRYHTESKNQSLIMAIVIREMASLCFTKLIQISYELRFKVKTEIMLICAKFGTNISAVTSRKTVACFLAYPL